MDSSLSARLRWVLSSTLGFVDTMHSSAGVPRLPSQRPEGRSNSIRSGDRHSGFRILSNMRNPHCLGVCDGRILTLGSSAPSWRPLVQYLSGQYIPRPRSDELLPPGRRLRLTSSCPSLSVKSRTLPVGLASFACTAIGNSNARTQRLRLIHTPRYSRVHSSTVSTTRLPHDCIRTVP